MESRLRSDERKLYGERHEAVNHCNISTIESHGLSLIIHANAGTPLHSAAEQKLVPSHVETKPETILWTEVNAC